MMFPLLFSSFVSIFSAYLVLHKSRATAGYNFRGPRKASGNAWTNCTLKLIHPIISIRIFITRNLDPGVSRFLSDCVLRYTSFSSRCPSQKLKKFRPWAQVWRCLIECIGCSREEFFDLLDKMSLKTWSSWVFWGSWTVLKSSGRPVGTIPPMFV